MLFGKKKKIQNKSVAQSNAATLRNCWATINPRCTYYSYNVMFSTLMEMEMLLLLLIVQWVSDSGEVKCVKCFNKPKSHFKSDDLSRCLSKYIMDVQYCKAAATT